MRCIQQHSGLPMHSGVVARQGVTHRNRSYSIGEQRAYIAGSGINILEARLGSVEGFDVQGNRHEIDTVRLSLISPIHSQSVHRLTHCMHGLPLHALQNSIALGVSTSGITTVKPLNSGDTYTSHARRELHDTEPTRNAAGGTDGGQQQARRIGQESSARNSGWHWTACMSPAHAVVCCEVLRAALRLLGGVVHPVQQLLLVVVHGRRSCDVCVVQVHHARATHRTLAVVVARPAATAALSQQRNVVPVRSLQQRLAHSGADSPAVAVRVNKRHRHSAHNTARAQRRGEKQAETDASVTAQMC